MTKFSLINVATVTILTGSLSACSFPFMKLPQAVTTESAVETNVAPAVQQQTASLSGAAPAPLVTSVTETGPTAAEIAEQERLERRERRRERNERDQERREREVDKDTDDDDGREGGWTP